MNRWMNKIHAGDALTVMKDMPDKFVQCIVTSPPYYGLRDYGNDSQIGLEQTPDEYVAKLVVVFREARRLLRDDGVMFLVIGDSYAGNRSCQVPDSKHREVGNSRGMRCGSNRADGVVNDESPRNRDGVLCPVGFKPKDQMLIPHRVAIALQSDGWWVRDTIIWHKNNPMPSSVKDRTTCAHEYVFLLTKSARYYWDADAIAEQCQSGESDIRKMKEQRPRIGGKHKVLVDPLSMASSTTNIGQKRSVGNGETRNRRSVWTIPTSPCKEAHFAVFPEALVEPCILAGSKPGDVILDPFSGISTVAVVAHKLRREWVMIELNPEYVAMAEARIKRETAQMRLPTS